MQCPPEVSPQLLFRATLYPTQLISKKNNRPIFRSKKTGRSFIGKSKALRDNEGELLLQLQSARNTFGIFKPITTRIFVRLLFGMDNITNRDGSFNKRQQDVDNLQAATLDALQAANIIENDNLIMSLHTEKIPSLEINIGIWIMEYDQSFSLKHYGT